MEQKRIIVAGIHTDAGKTIASAVLCEALNADYWKPVQAGGLDQTDSHTVEKLISNETTIIHPEAYRLTEPMSPHAAAEIDGVDIEGENLRLPDTTNHLIVELAGGLMVPMSENLLNIDFVQKTSLPVVLVTNYYLGSINHTLLSWELLKERKVPVLGMIFNGEKNAASFDIISHFTQAKCLLEIDQETIINPKTIEKYASRIAL